MNADIPENVLRSILDDVESALKNDLVSHGELRQIMRCYASSEIKPDLLETVISQLLNEGVEIGRAVNVDGKYVKFTAWKGDVGQRIKRAKIEIDCCADTDKPFAFWLCLSANVDGYEPVQG